MPYVNIKVIEDVVTQKQKEELSYLNKPVGSWFLAHALDSTALQKNTRLTCG